MSATSPKPEPLRTPLPEAELPPSVARAVGPQAPPAMRLMAARGLAPLPPGELTVALYQLAAGADAALLATAVETTGKLPEQVLKVALPAALPAPVLDFLARQLHPRPEALALLLANRALPDETVVFLAGACPEDALEIIAKDEQRLLRCPAIIAALYLNPQARASTSLRAVELAARNNVVVDIPGFEEVVAALQGVSLSTADDEKFRRIVPREGASEVASGDAAAELSAEEIERTQAAEEAGVKAPEAVVEEKKKRFEDMSVPFQIRAATLGNAFDRSIAVRSTVRLVCMAAVKSPALSINEVIKFASNRALHSDVIGYIANRKEWVQLTSIKLALIYNNKTPLGTAMRFLNFLQSRDLKAVARSRQIPSALVKGAKELMAKREKRS